MDIKNARYIVNGAHESGKLQDMLDGFIRRFVLCPECENPETELVRGGDGMVGGFELVVLCMRKVVFLSNYYLYFKDLSYLFLILLPISHTHTHMHTHTHTHAHTHSMYSPLRAGSGSRARPVATTAWWT